MKNISFEVQVNIPPKSKETTITRCFTLDEKGYTGSYYNRAVKFIRILDRLIENEYDDSENYNIAINVKRKGDKMDKQKEFFCMVCDNKLKYRGDFWECQNNKCPRYAKETPKHTDGEPMVHG